jgi:hypothetical protein
VEICVGKRLFAFALVVSLSISGLIAIAILLFGEFDDTSARILATTGLIGLFSLLSLPAGVLIDRGRALALAWILVGLAVASFLLAVVLLWAEIDDEAGWKTALTLGLLSGAMSQNAATTLRRRETDTVGVRVLYLASIAGAFLVAGLSTLAAWQEIDDDGFYRGLGAVVVGNLLTVLLQPAARRMAGTPAPSNGRRHSVVFTIDGAASDAALDEAKRTLERHGLRVESVERRS